MRELHKQFYVLYEKKEEMRMQGEKDTVIGEKSMKNEEYKKLSIKEFTKAAGRYESNYAGIYEMCKKDYPDPQAFFDSVKRCLRPNGRLILRDVTSDNKVLVWLMNTLEMPLANIGEMCIRDRAEGESKRKAFLGGVLSGVVEPIGAVLTLSLIHI